VKLPPLRFPNSVVGRAALGLPLLAVVVALFIWRGPSFSAIGNAFASVKWQWVAAAIALNLVSVIVRALAWTTVIRSAMKPPHPAPPLVFSAFSVGLFANAVLPGRIGELARVAVLTRKMPGRKGAWATLVGTVFAHRVFDVVPVVLLVVFVVATANIPTSARASLIAAICIGIALFAFAFISARRPQEPAPLEGRGRAGRLIAMARQGLGVMRSPLGAAAAVLFQIAGWVCQLFAVYTAMRAFDIHSPLPAAGVVLLLMNVVTIFPFWPRAGRDRVGARGLRRRVRARDCVRLRPPGDRGVGRDRRRCALPRARGIVDGDAEGDAERCTGRDECRRRRGA
jgi:hypothetical protein